ncbi:hypothetical protein [uncultured Aquimarina sp.]|uniref:hypothetical protein n=1 Tax=uncultured Aquimarina sp. TaxID=575652 RepID=UPI0026062EF2|nr:hypothetical protein [uncultured Aquimarina sp.]
MNTSLKHTISLKDGTAYYVIFDSISDFHCFVDAQMEALSGGNFKVYKSMHTRAASGAYYGSGWYGTPAPTSIEDLQNHNRFLGMHLIKVIQPKIRKRLEHYLKLVEDQILPKPKLQFNDKGLGVFSFDRAAMGLFRMQPTAVNTNMQKNISQMKIELDRDNKTTSIKKVYAQIKDKASSFPSLQLYITAGANANIKGNQLLYIGLACAELVEFMELRGIAVEVNIIFETFFNGNYPIGVVRLKRFEDRLDKNQLLLLSSDPRYYRYRGFKALIALSNYFGLTIPSGLGAAKDGIGKDFIKALDLGGVVFEQSFDINSAVNEVTEIIKTYSQKLKNR